MLGPSQAETNSDQPCMLKTLSFARRANQDRWWMLIRSQLFPLNESNKAVPELISYSLDRIWRGLAHLTRLARISRFKRWLRH
jgi:hypothetical protein